MTDALATPGSPVEPHSAAPPAPPSPGRVGVLAAFAVFFVTGATTASLGAGLPLLEDRFGLTHGAGQVVVWYNVGAFVAVAALGAVGTWLALSRAVTLTLLLFSGGCLAMAASPAWALFCATAVVAGCGYGGLGLILNTAFGRGFGANSVVMVNRLNAVFGIGAAAGPLAAGTLGRWHIQAIPLIAAFLVLLCLPARLLDKGGDRPPVTAAETTPSRSTPGMWIFLLCATGFLYAGTETSIGAWESTQLTWDGWSEPDAALATSGFWGGLVIGRLVLPALTRRIPAATLLPAYLAAGTLFIGLSAVSGLTSGAYLLAGIAVAPVLPTLIAWLIATVDKPQRWSSVLILGDMASNAAMPAAVGLLAGSQQPFLVSLALAGVCGMGLAVALVARRRARQWPT
ncbi:MFS transporter [Streptomyces sp. NPDC006458]|uniref:MFS transporter n=1 Tax=Streptomyces sp. NPDC006458 TaxID=3154302 RepID=UPI0033B5B755